MFTRMRSWGGRPARDPWIVVLLVLVFLVPSAVVLWFTAQTVSTQSAAARQRVLEAYRGQLRLARSRIDAHWERQAVRLDGAGHPDRRFAQLILDQTAEGAILLAPDGTLAFPDPANTRPADLEPFPAGADITEPVGRAHELLASARRSPPGSLEREQTADRLASLLNDYAAGLPAAVRLSLMGELRALEPNIRLPTEAALELSHLVVESGPPEPAPGGFRPTAVDDVWALTSTDGATIGLYRTGRLESLLHDLLHEVSPEGIRFVAIPPGEPGDAEAVPAGAWLPGWQISFDTIDMTPFDAAALREVMSSVAVGFAGIALMIVLGVTAGGAVRRQLQLARLKTDLVAAVSHELRTPVSSIGVLVEGLLADPHIDPDRTREYLRLVAAENERLGRLVENFLTFSRLEHHAHHFVFAPESPAALVSAALDVVRTRLGDACELTVDVPADLPAVRADRDALVTAFVNLLDNAIKYTGADRRIGLRARHEGDAVVVAVADNGIGIPAHEHRRIFWRFHRVDRRLARETSGVGLGLSIVDLIVRAHGGTVSVTSAPEAGSTFVVRLPLATEPAAA
jgi:signal transduction histidine kinase